MYALKLRSDPLEDHESGLEVGKSPRAASVSEMLRIRFKELVAILQDSLEALDHVSEY